MTNQAMTFEVFNRYLEADNRVDVQTLADEIQIVSTNIQRLYNEMNNRRRRPRAVAIEWLMQWTNQELGFAGHRGFEATNKQVMSYDRQHGGSLEAVLDELEAYIRAQREEA